MPLQFNPKNEPIRYDPSGVFIDEHGIQRSDLAELGPRLEAARSETLADVELWKSKRPVPQEKQPLGASFIELPERLLAAYKQDRHGSELGRILDAAARL